MNITSSNRHHDLLIIGSGASGAAAAWSLSSEFQDVACFEQGDWTDPSKYPSTRNDWELSKTKDFSPLPNVRNLSVDYEIDDSESPISVANFNGVGGSTILYSGHFPRFHPSDFNAFSQDGVGYDWGFGYTDLEPFYNLNDQMMGVSGLSGDPAYPEITGMLPPIDIGPIGNILGNGFNKLGWHWWPSYSAIITREKDGRGRCINLGPCNTGCPQGAKSSVDITYWPKAIKNGVKLYTNFRVYEIVVDKNDKVLGVNYFDKDGNTNFCSCRILLLACNGIGTPRLLLNSRSKLRQETLANRSGLVGKNLMLHPLGFIEGFFNEDFDSTIGPHGSCIYSHQFYETDESRGFKRGFTMQILRGPKPIEFTKSAIQRRLLPYGKDHIKAFKDLYGKNIGISIICEDLPEECNMVQLHENKKDLFGIPIPKITYRLSNNTKKMMSFGIQRGQEVLEASGASKVFSFGPVRNTGWHLIGTAKMGFDPEKSVVGINGMSHDVGNLFVIDSSIFPTSSGVNPASTIQAVALYISNWIKNNKGSL